MSGLFSLMNSVILENLFLVLLLVLKLNFMILLIMFLIVLSIIFLYMNLGNLGSLIYVMIMFGYGWSGEKFFVYGWIVKYCLKIIYGFCVKMLL